MCALRKAQKSQTSSSLFGKRSRMRRGKCQCSTRPQYKYRLFRASHMHRCKQRRLSQCNSKYQGAHNRSLSSNCSRNRALGYRNRRKLSSKYSLSPSPKPVLIQRSRPPKHRLLRKLKRRLQPSSRKSTRNSGQKRSMN